MSGRGPVGHEHEEAGGIQPHDRRLQTGRIDMILTKSLSRFARNTVDCLRIVRRLKANGIGVIFQNLFPDSLATPPAEPAVYILPGPICFRNLRSLFANGVWPDFPTLCRLCHVYAVLQPFFSLPFL